MTDDKFRILLENNMRGGPASVMGNRYVKRSDTKKDNNWILLFDMEQENVTSYQQETLLKLKSLKETKTKL